MSRGFDETSCPSRRFRRRPWSSPRGSHSRPRSSRPSPVGSRRRQQVPTGPKVGEMPLNADGTVGVPDRLEAFHRPLALPGRLVGVLGAVVQVLRPAMLHRQHELAVRHLVAGELVGDEHPGHVPQALEQSAEALCGHRIQARLDQNVERVAVLVDRARQVPLCAVDLDDASSRCHLSPGRRPRRRSSFAYCCPNRSHQARMVSSDTSTPVRASVPAHHGSSTGTMVSQTQWLMISGGNRNPLYDEPAAVTIVDPAPPHLPASPI